MLSKLLHLVPDNLDMGVCVHYLTTQANISMLHPHRWNGLCSIYLHQF